MSKKKEYLWVITGVVSACLGLIIGTQFFSKSEPLLIAIISIVIMAFLLLLVGAIVHFKNKELEKDQTLNMLAWPEGIEQKRFYKKHWIEIATVLLVIAIFLSYLIFDIITHGQYSSEKLKTIAFPAFIFCQLINLTIIFRTQFLIYYFLKKHPTIENDLSLDQLKPFVSQCMIMALIFIALLLTSMFFAAIILINLSAFYSTITVLCFTIMSILIKWHAQYEEKLKQIKCNNPLLEPELNQILQSWQNNLLPKF